MSHLKYSNYLPLCKKSEKTNDSFLRKMPKLTGSQTHTDNQTNNGDFIGSSVGQGSIKIRIQTIWCLLTKKQLVLTKNESSIEGKNMQTQYSLLGYRNW